MSLLAAHLEQISVSCQGIDSLPFPPPRIFTNALLTNHDITSLIRDTETHERALFSVPPPPAPAPAATQAPDPAPTTSRRQTVFNVAAGEVTTGPPPGSGRAGAAPRRHTAVAAVLGGDLHGTLTRHKGEVDIEVLLRGAEKLCHVYPLPGALDRIPAQRSRHAHQCNTLAYYEAKVAGQVERLEGMHKDWMTDEGEDGNEDDEDGGEGDAEMTEDDLRREEEELKELDRKKKVLQGTLRAMEEDLGGLMNM